MSRRHERGMVLGKFMPPHLGHVYLVDFARHYVDRLTVVVGTLAREPIPGTLRYAWMRELFPWVDVVHLTDENPQEPSEHPDFWRIWEASLRRVLPGPVDLVFASEPYGETLASVLGARFVAVDVARSVMPISGTAIRNDPLGSWGYLPRCVRPYYLLRVSLFGPESTGKSRLAERLAGHYRTCFVPEYARAFLERQQGRIELSDIPLIARGQAAAEEALALAANRVLICDTDPLLTTVWSDALFGECADEVRKEASVRRYQLSLLTDVDVPWVPDPVRYLPDQRETFLARCQAMLDAHSRTTVRLCGDWDARFATACRAIDALLGSVRTA